MIYLPVSPVAPPNNTAFVLLTKCMQNHLHVAAFGYKKFKFFANQIAACKCKRGKLT